MNQLLSQFQHDKVIEKILLIDDEPSVLLALKLLLQAIGFTVTDRNDPTLGVELLQQVDSFDLVICDLKMPKLDGLAVLRETMRARPRTPFILMSAHATSTDVEKARALGATGFLAKPFSPEDLRALIGRFSPSKTRGSVETSPAVVPLISPESLA